MLGRLCIDRKLHRSAAAKLNGGSTMAAALWAELSVRPLPNADRGKACESARPRGATQARIADRPGRTSAENLPSLVSSHRLSQPAVGSGRCDNCCGILCGTPDTASSASAL